MKALYLSKILINIATKMGRPISVYQLNRILYLLYKDYFRLTYDYLFEDQIVALKALPVVFSVYKHYAPYGAIPINREYESLLFPLNILPILNNFIHYMELSIFDLRNLTDADLPYREARSKGSKLTIEVNNIIEDILLTKDDKYGILK